MGPPLCTQGALGGEFGAWEETTWGAKKISPLHVSSLVQGHIPRLLPVKFPINSSWLHCKKVRMGGGGRARGAPFLRFSCLTYKVEKVSPPANGKGMQAPWEGLVLACFTDEAKPLGLARMQSRV